MKAGAKYGWTVGQAYEFPEDFRRGKRKAIALLGAFSLFLAFLLLPNIAQEGMSGVLPNLVVLLMLVGVLVQTAVSWPPVVISDGFVRLKGKPYEADRVSAVDVYIPKGRHVTKALPMRFLFTIRGVGHDRPVEVLMRLTVDQARRLLAEVRRMLPHTLACDRSGLIETPSEDMYREPPEQGRPPSPPPCLEPRALNDLRIKPEHVSTERPRWARDPRTARDARRGARHQERLALATRLVRVRTFRIPAVVAEWA